MDIKSNKELSRIESFSKDRATHNVWVGSYAILAACCVIAYFLFRLHVFDVFGKNLLIIKKLTLAGAATFCILIASRFIERFAARRAHTPAVSYNLIRLVRLLTVIVIAIVIISLVFVNWYAAAMSLGLVSLILGFALQNPISSFIGWIYIIIRNPYKVGDRVQIGTFKGDIVEIGYLDTTLWEFAGDYITNDLPSGRLILFPNNQVFSTSVYNYSWHKFPYIWNEIPFYFGFGSDLDFIESLMKSVTKEVLGPGMAENIKELKELVEKTPIDELEIKEYPIVCFRVNANTWVEATLTYLVAPKHAATTRNRIIKEVLAEMAKVPEKALIPNGNSR